MAAGFRERAACAPWSSFPLVTAGRVVGGLLLSANHPHAFSDDDLALGAALGSQAAQALERARLFDAERRVSVTLQRSLLPASLPDVEGVELDLRYLPAAGLEAGGDFYEAVPLRRRLAGRRRRRRRRPRRHRRRRDGPAAQRPARVRADRRRPGRAADAGCRASRTRSPRRWRRRRSWPSSTRPRAGCVYACAGHPWPVYVTADGTAELLQGGRGVPLGCLPEPQYREAVVDLEPGATLLLYTDGLTERRGEDMDAALERLRAAAGAHARGPAARAPRPRGRGSPAPIAPSDDVALVAMRFTGVTGTRRLAFPAELAQVPIARHAIRDWLAGARRRPACRRATCCWPRARPSPTPSSTRARPRRGRARLRVPRPGTIRIVVRDDGRWKDPVVSPHRGRGFGLMRTLMDECTVQRGDGGTVVRLSTASSSRPRRAPSPARRLRSAAR